MRRVLCTACAIASGVFAIHAAAAPAQAGWQQTRLERAGVQVCRTMRHGTKAQHACFALQRLFAGPSMVFQTSQEVRNTWAVAKRAPLALRRRYAQAAYDVFRTYFGPRGWRTGGEAVAWWPGIRCWFDDNANIGNDLMQLYQGTRLRKLLAAAEGVFQFDLSGLWHRGQPPAQRYHPGGIYQNQARRERNAGTQAGAIEFALRLYAATHERHYLRFAEHLYWWTRATLGTSSGRYHEQIGPHGKITGSAFVQTDGRMISNGEMLYRNTRRRAYLIQAQQTAAATARQYGLVKIEKADPMLDSIYFYSTPAFSRAALVAYVAHERTRLRPNGLVKWTSPLARFPARDWYAPAVRQEQAAQAGVLGAMVLADEER